MTLACQSTVAKETVDPVYPSPRSMVGPWLWECNFRAYSSLAVPGDSFHDRISLSARVGSDGRQEVFVQHSRWDKALGATSASTTSSASTGITLPTAALIGRAQLVGNLVVGAEAERRLFHYQDTLLRDEPDYRIARRTSVDASMVEARVLFPDESWGVEAHKQTYRTCRAYWNKLESRVDLAHLEKICYCLRSRRQVLVRVIIEQKPRYGFGSSWLTYHCSN
jgi:hypothetical protein